VFGKSKDLEKDNARFDPQIGTVLDGLKALTLPQLAASVMAKGFSADYQAGDAGSDADGIASGFSPYPPFKLHDTTIRGGAQEGEAAADPTSSRAKWLQIKDLVAEGLQALEKASLIVQTEHFDGVATAVAYTTTRSGRDAITQNTVESLVAAGTP
jgi:hypothetical protein